MRPHVSRSGSGLAGRTHLWRDFVRIWLTESSRLWSWSRLEGTDRCRGGASCNDETPLSMRPWLASDPLGFRSSGGDRKWSHSFANAHVNVTKWPGPTGRNWPRPILPRAIIHTYIPGRAAAPRHCSEAEARPEATRGSPKEQQATARKARNEHYVKRHSN